MTLLELEARVGVLVSEIQGIDAQLAACKPIGRVTNEEWREYNEWKGKAVWAKKHLVDEARDLKTQLKAARVDRNASGSSTALPNPHILQLAGPEELLAAAEAFMRRIAMEFDVSPEEEALQHRIQSWLDAHWRVR